MKAKDRKWLEMVHADSDVSLGMYRGTHPNCIPEAPATRLERAGLIYCEYPHNPAHKPRWIITGAGRAALSEPRT